jgi:hypothetical protein
VGRSTTCAIGDLESGATYYFAVTAYNTSGYESNYSSELRYPLGEPSRRSPSSYDDDPQPGQSDGGSFGGGSHSGGQCFIETSSGGGFADTKAILAKCSLILTLIFCGLAI